jgi:hypothetical protein
MDSQEMKHFKQLLCLQFQWQTKKFYHIDIKGQYYKTLYSRDWET